MISLDFFQIWIFLNFQVKKNLSELILWEAAVCLPYFSLSFPVCVSLPSKYLDAHLGYVHSSNYTYNLSHHGFCRRCLSSSISLLSNTCFLSFGSPERAFNSCHSLTQQHCFSSHILAPLSPLCPLPYFVFYSCCAVFVITPYKILVLKQLLQWKRCTENAGVYCKFMFFFYVFQCRIQPSFICLEQSIATLSLCSIISPSCSQSVRQMHCTMSMVTLLKPGVWQKHQQQQSSRIKKEHWPRQRAVRDSPPHTLQ